MDKHPSYASVEPFARRYPQQAPALFQAWIDLKHAARWVELEPVDLPGVGAAALKGRKSDKEAQQFIFPCTLATSLSMARFTAVFEDLPSPTPDSILLAVLSPDSTVVYYKISKGMVKPIN